VNLLARLSRIGLAAVCVLASCGRAEAPEPVPPERPPEVLEWNSYRDVGGGRMVPHEDFRIDFGSDGTFRYATRLPAGEGDWREVSGTWTPVVSRARWTLLLSPDEGPESSATMKWSGHVILGSEPTADAPRLAPVWLVPRVDFEQGRFDESVSIVPTSSR
jgi:hypothetical protein